MTWKAAAVGAAGGLAAVVALASRPNTPAARSATPTPADGHTIHVLAPHVIHGKIVGPFHHYCKVVAADPIIECLIFMTTDSMARLTDIEYIVAKSITRTAAISLVDWNRNWHDHQVEIASGRVKVLDVPDSVATQIANTVSQTDGIVFHLWGAAERVPSGHVMIPQAVGHVNLTRAQKFMH